MIGQLVLASGFGGKRFGGSRIARVDSPAGLMKVREKQGRAEREALPAEAPQKGLWGTDIEL
jgi:hypothetical protein